jgi:hypothetical protein
MNWINNLPKAQREFLDSLTILSLTALIFSVASLAVNIPLASYGWPVPFLTERTADFELANFIMNTLAWFALSAIVWGGYQCLVKPSSKSRKSPAKRSRK